MSFLNMWGQGQKFQLAISSLKHTHGGSVLLNTKDDLRPIAHQSSTRLKQKKRAATINLLQDEVAHMTGHVHLRKTMVT